MPDLWAGVLAPSRATTWEGAGVAGGIPTRTTVFQQLGVAGQLPTFVQSSVNTAAVQNAINACPGGQVIFFNPGVYTLGGLSIVKNDTTPAIRSQPYGNGITLRGAGAHQTKIILTSTVDAFMTPTGTLVIWSGEHHDGVPSGSGGGLQNTANWTAGYALGTTVITLSSVSNLFPGMHLILDQIDDTTDWPSAPGLIVGEAPPLSYEGGNHFTRGGRGNCQVVTVTAINGLSVTIDPPVRLPN